MTKNKALLLWSIVPLLALVEILQQRQIQQQEPSSQDWGEAVRFVAARKQKKDLVVIAPAWAVQGRTYFASMLTFKDFGRFDTTLYDRIFEVSAFGATSPETEKMKLEDTQRFGRIAVRTFRLSRPDEVLFDFVDHLKEAAADKGVERQPKIIIDHWFNPRWVIGTKLSGRSTLTFSDVPLGGVLRGWGIIDYREGRFNEGGPAKILVYLNEKRLGRVEVANFGPLKPFEFDLAGTGTGTVRFEISASGNPKRELGLAADVRKKGRR